ncbi:zinc ribbon domain-containing protein [Butyrivibrio sp. AE3006]|uniref:zinc ribbon domain-containing protein n=1 Tax=Butyrivibrio sp. AE3006 TaxID=1280673 RepID=UPI00040FA188|nr:zinc ribbon domain-containing protein [Butyrivibrio sp. AE3006]
MPLIACPDCGKKISSRATQCPYCGCPAAYFDESSSSENDERHEECLKNIQDTLIKDNSQDDKNDFGKKIQTQSIKEKEPSVAESTEGNKLGMGWYYILIAFGFPYSIIQLVLAIITNKEWLNAGIIASDVLLILYMCIAWYGLATFKKNSPYLLYGAHGINIILSIILLIIIYVYKADNLVNNTTYLSGIMSSAVILLISIVYYGNRRHMFINTTQYMLPFAIFIGVSTIVSFLAGIFIIPFFEGVSRQIEYYESTNKSSVEGIKPDSSDDLGKNSNDSIVIEYVPMTYSGNTYISNALGIKYETTDDMPFESVKELDYLSQDVSGDEFYEKLKQDIESSKTRTEMHCESINNLDMVSSSVTYVGFLDLNGDDSFDEFYETMRNTLIGDESLFGEVSEEIEEVNPDIDKLENYELIREYDDVFCGYKSKHIEFTVKHIDLEQPLYLDLCVFLANDYMGQVLFRGYGRSVYRQYITRFSNLDDSMTNIDEITSNEYSSFEYIIITTTGKFHSVDCQNALDANEQYKEYSSKSYFELIDEGYTPHECISILFGNSKGMIFHKQGCKNAAGLADKYKVYGLSRQQFIDAGYEPCKYCNP